MFVEHGYNVYLAEEIKKHVKTPVATLGGLNDPDMMEEIIASGKADIIEIARQSICDPYFPEKAFSGRKDEDVYKRQVRIRSLSSKERNTDITARTLMLSRCARSWRNTARQAC